MALLPDIPFVSVDDTRVAPDSPTSTDLFTDMCIDINYLKSTMTDGLAAAQALVNLNNLTVNGTLTVIGSALLPQDALIVTAL